MKALLFISILMAGSATMNAQTMGDSTRRDTLSANNNSGYNSYSNGNMNNNATNKMTNNTTTTNATTTNTMTTNTMTTNTNGTYGNTVNWDVTHYAFAALPVVETYMGSDVMGNMKTKYGANLYDITSYRFSDTRMGYIVRTMDPGAGQIKSVYVSEDGSTVVNSMGQ